MDYKISRDKGIGGSDISSVFNLAPHGCRRRLFYEKTGVVADYPKISTAIDRGNMLEEVAAQVFTKETGRKIRKPNRDFRSKEYPWMMGHLDRLVIDQEETVPLEVKCPGRSMFMKMVRHGLNDEYMLQVQDYIFLKRSSYGVVSLFCSETVQAKHFDFSRDESMIKEIIKACASFWSQYYLAGLTPEPLPDDAAQCPVCSHRIKCRGDLGQFLVPETDMVYAPDLNELFLKHVAAKEEVDGATEVLESIKDDIREALGERSKVFTDHGKIYMSLVETNRFQTKLFEKDYPDLAKQYKKLIPSRPLRVFPGRGEA